jgi:hypothetical protein
MGDDAFFPALTVREHLQLTAYGHGVAEPDERVEGLLAEFGLTGRADALPSALSSGQRRRLVLAAALARPRSLLVLDEPEQRLDAGMRRRLATAGAGVRRGRRGAARLPRRGAGGRRGHLGAAAHRGHGRGGPGRGGCGCPRRPVSRPVPSGRSVRRWTSRTARQRAEGGLLTLLGEVYSAALSVAIVAAVAFGAAEEVGAASLTAPPPPEGALVALPLAGSPSWWRWPR